ncbi:MAG: hypothetical protein LBI45_05825 [Bacteroidales bacterium]|nr:hypothetical protein [Bacteroidales bacterium]
MLVAGSRMPFPISFFSTVTFRISLFFRTSTDEPSKACESPKPNMALAIFGCALGKVVFLSRFVGRKHDLAHWQSDPITLSQTY